MTPKLGQRQNLPSAQKLTPEQAEDIFTERLAEILIDQIKASMKLEATNKEI